MTNVNVRHSFKFKIIFHDPTIDNYYESEVEKMKMTKEEAKEEIRYVFTKKYADKIIKALEQEPCEDEIILTKEEYRQLLSSEFDNGYAKGYREALEQESILDKIRTEIQQADFDFGDFYDHTSTIREKVLDIIDKYTAESEVDK